MSECESTQPNCEDDHLHSFSSSSPLTALPPAQKTTARQDQAGKASTDDGTRNRTGSHTNVREYELQVVVVAVTPSGQILKTYISSRRY